MAALGDVAAQVGTVLERLVRCQYDLAEARRHFGVAHAGLSHTLSGSTNPAAKQALSALARARTSVFNGQRALRATEDALRRYLVRFSFDADSPNPRSDIDSNRPSGRQPRPRADSLAQRIENARGELGRGRRGTVARGIWLRDATVSHLNSGDRDEYYEVARRFIRETFRAERAVERLATHVETKVAIQMRREGLTTTTLVIDRQTCGTLPKDRTWPLTCQNYLARFLASGAVLRVVEPDGRIREYRGKDAR